MAAIYIVTLRRGLFFSLAEGSHGVVTSMTVDEARLLWLPSD